VSMKRGWRPRADLSKRVGMDATTLEASAAMRSIVRRDTGESYEEFLTGPAKASEIGTSTRVGSSWRD
jgi:transposase